MLSFEIRIRKMSSLIYYSTFYRGSSQCCQARILNRSHPDGKGEVKHSLFTDSIISYVKNKMRPGRFSCKELTCQCWRYGFDPSSGKIPHAPEQLSPCANHWAGALKPGSHNYWSLHAAITKPACPRNPCSAMRNHCSKPTYHT